MEIRVSIKYVVLVIRVQKNTWSKTLYHLFLFILNKNVNEFKSGSFCFGLLYLSKTI